MVITVLRAPYSGAGTMAPVHGRWYLPTTALLSFFFFLSHQQEQAQGTGGAVSWIPTQSQNSLLAQLASISESELSSADVALKTRAILGIIPYQQVLALSRLCIRKSRRSHAPFLGPKHHCRRDRAAVCTVVHLATSETLLLCLRACLPPESCR